jgi:hypothetical protein
VGFERVKRSTRKRKKEREKERKKERKKERIEYILRASLMMTP